MYMCILFIRNKIKFENYVYRMKKFPINMKEIFFDPCLSKTFFHN